MAKLRTLILTVPLLVGALLAAAPPAAAHAHVMVDDTYEFTIGWIHEPPYVDQPNGVWLRVLGPAPALESGLIEPGESFSHTFHKVGTVGYHCHPHPWMKGNVTVVDTGASPTVHHVAVVDGESNGDYRFVPENLVVGKGDTVVWTVDAAASMPHQIMADTVMHHDDGSHGAHGAQHDDGAHHEEGAHAEEGEASGGHHAHDAVAPVTGVDQTLQVEVTIAGKAKTFALSPVHGEPGAYVARFIPTVGGTYTAHFTGTLNGVEADVTIDLQRVEALDAVQFPEKASSLYDVQKRLDAQAEEIAALKQQLDTQARTPADVEPAGGSDTPFVGLAALAGVAVVAATLMRRRA